MDSITEEGIEYPRHRVIIIHTQALSGRTLFRIIQLVTLSYPPCFDGSFLGIRRGIQTCGCDPIEGSLPDFKTQ